MDLYEALRALYDERQRLDKVIASLEELQRRNALAAKFAAGPIPRRRGRKFMDEEARRQVSERMKAYWEKRKKEPHPEEPGAPPKGA